MQVIHKHTNAYITLYTVCIAQCTISIKAYCIWSNEREKTMEKIYITFSILIYLSCCWIFHFDSTLVYALPIIFIQQSVYKFHCSLYTVHHVPYRPELSTPKTSQGRGHKGVLLLWLISRLILSSSLGKLASIFYDFKNCC